jgi:hypothetical protein
LCSHKNLVAESDQKSYFPPLKNFWFCQQNLNEKIADLVDNSDSVPSLVSFTKKAQPILAQNSKKYDAWRATPSKDGKNMK